MTAAGNSFEGGSNGTTVTTGNSGGGSGDAFDSVSIGTSATATFANDHPAHGSLGLKISTGATSTTSLVAYTTAIGTQTTFYGRAYLYLTANPTAGSWRFFWARGAGAGRASLIVNTAGKVAALNAAGGTIFTFTGTVPLNQTFRVEWMMVISATVGQVEAKQFSTADSTTADETQTSAATQALGGANTDEYRWGILTSQANAGPFWLDDVKVDSASYPGPAAANRVRRQSKWR